MLNGNRSMGIYATNSELSVGGDTTITVKDAVYYNYGISNFYDDDGYDFRYSDADPKLTFEGDLNITTVGGNNSVGINLKDDKYNSNGEDTITVKGHLNINASGAKEYEWKKSDQKFPNSVSNYGMFMYSIAGASFNSATITTDAVGDRVESIGSYAYWNSNMTFDGDVEYNTSATDKDVEISALARAGSNITFNRGLSANGAVVLNAAGSTSNKASTIKVNPNALTDADVRLDGNIVAGKTTSAYIWGDKYDTMTDNDDTHNVISANLMNANSYLTGVNEFGNAGSEIDLRFENGASWNMTDSSPVTDLVLANGGQADMTYGNTGDKFGSFRTLTTSSLSGEGGVINMNIDAGTNADNSDRVYVTGTHTGEHLISLNNVNSASLTDGANGTVLVSVGDEQGKFSALAAEGKLYWNRYELGDKESATDGYNTDWYLKEIIQEETGGSDDKPTTSVEAGLSANALGYHTWRAEMDSLMQRMGDLRQEDEPDNGAWFRAKGGKINRDGAFGFENEYVMYQLGYDDVLKRTDKYTSYIGVAFSYTDGEGSYYRGDGENEGKEFGVYYTKMHKNGHYFDVAVKAGRWDNDFDVTDRSGNRISGDYDNNSFAFSAEYGRKIAMGAKGWYVEPQAQLSWGYFSGANYTMSNGVSVRQSGITSLLGRVGFNIGRDINKYSNIYLKANLYHEFCGDYSVSMNDGAGSSYRRSDVFDDTWFEYGIGAAFKWGEDARFYIDAERSAGSDYEKEWTLNAGLAWTF
ncbi:autotransporter outer membrane beta-barrel domain-containing protein [uncultured Cloacibacillus sp.]|uniref:autotransporter outer membrane beta-barrel domain-containing protein n=1 Tax=uncultured Cloacibacillus sp. TaxID=889794 RepID=UPI0025DA4C4B|nr:autotransporter outer membrane beta-barrel domain-containing protein [uncultured Cloacibacillus sp.]